ncbi:unnamed protein product [Cuscuta campestris]|uniref:Uncharacterized protein n=1 Tax=Cuscuta campestris TaxID=132261 RepID=A0A484NPG1_9ASTE|nr:unnamed protein product [Cuscuta campestris]
MQYEPLGFCCCRGEVLLASSEMPALLRDYSIIINDVKAKQFQYAAHTCMQCDNTKRISAEMSGQIGAIHFTIFTQDLQKLLRLLEVNSTPESRKMHLNNQLVSLSITRAIKRMPPN